MDQSKPIKSEAGTVQASELGNLLDRYGVEPPEELAFPATFKLNEKYALTLAQRGLMLKDGRYEQAYSYMVTKNQVVLMDRSE
jgi:hypothetical protein